METKAFELWNGTAVGKLLLVCDHASNELPQDYGTLGMPADALASHIAYDIGAATLTRALADQFAAPAILGRWSRLLVDLNRGADDPTVVAKLSDGQLIPGNRDIGPAEIARRIERFHAPYHAAVATRLAASRAAGDFPTIVSIHSFTPVWRGHQRPWHIGILWDRDARLPAALMERLQRDADIVVGNNEPYSGALENDTLYRHGTMNGLPHVLIEVRQDLIADKAGIARWSVRLREALHDALHAMGPPGLFFSRTLAAPEGGIAMDEKIRTELEAAAFRRLVAHLRSRTDVQNIDMMNLAGFCRNCLGDWYREAAAEKGIILSKDDGRAIVYGMAPEEWKKRYQKEASAETQAKFSSSQKTHS